jgi:hypothetical protein
MVLLVLVFYYLGTTATDGGVIRGVTDCCTVFPAPLTFGSSGAHNGYLKPFQGRLGGKVFPVGGSLQGSPGDNEEVFQHGKIILKKVEEAVRGFEYDFCLQ